MKIEKKKTNSIRNDPQQLMLIPGNVLIANMHLKLKFLNQGQKMPVQVCRRFERAHVCQTTVQLLLFAAAPWRTFLAYWYETRHYCVKIIKFCISVLFWWFRVCVKPILCMLLHGHQIQKHEMSTLSTNLASLPLPLPRSKKKRKAMWFQSGSSHYYPHPPQDLRRITLNTTFT